MCQLAMPTTCVASISFVVCFILATPGACSFSNAVYDSDYSASAEMDSDYSASAEMVAPARQDLSGRNIRSGRGRRSGSAPVYRNGRGVDLGSGRTARVFGKIRVTGGWSCDHESYRCKYSPPILRSGKWIGAARKLGRKWFR
eukprot:TRINITY_DN392_c0_g1_i2.p1 TRINITY_DN392_c0_g1~~TRINITY_DN392_c0_g1_i2.p1  ORF type:complete len:143 (-),score=2.48 TRINITY_DN392_c0_g1_i2:198-626(-)